MNNQLNLLVKHVNNLATRGHTGCLIMMCTPPTAKYMKVGAKCNMPSWREFNFGLNEPCLSMVSLL